MRVVSSTERPRLDRSTRRVVSGVLVAAVFTVGFGHLFILGSLDGMAFGVPTWLWAQLVVLGCMLAMAWLAVELAVSDRSAGGDPR